MKKFLLYLLRWQLSTLILAPCIYFLPFGAVLKSIIANLIGGCIFFWFDKWLFKERDELICSKCPYNINFYWEE